MTMLTPQGWMPISEVRRQVTELKKDLQEFNKESEKAIVNVNELNRSARTYLALARRGGLPENVMQAITSVYQLDIAFKTAYRSAMMLYGATGLLGIATGVGGIALGVLMLVDQMEIRRPRY